MDEIKELILNLKMESKILQALVDEILGSCELSYTGKYLSITCDNKILTIIKTFYPEEYNNRLLDLKQDLKKKIDEARREIEDPTVKEDANNGED